MYKTMYLSTGLMVGLPLICHVSVLACIMLADLYRVLLSVYQESESLPLPTMEEVLLCHDGTTSEDVSDVSCVIP